MGALEGKVAIVTGGGSGIGLATARRFADEGAQVVVADLNADAGAKAAAELGGCFVQADVGSPDHWRRIVEEADALGGADIAYLNAGVTTGNADITTLTDEQYRRIMGPNVDGVVFGVRAVVPAMEKKGGGAVVATASLAGLIAFPPDPIYTMTKHAVVGLIRSLAPQLAAKSITCNAVNPGIVDTPLVGEARERLQLAGFPMIPPEGIAEAVFSLVTGTDTGQCLVCQPGREPEPYRFHEVPGPGGAAAHLRPPPVESI